MLPLHDLYPATNYTIVGLPGQIRATAMAAITRCPAAAVGYPAALWDVRPSTRVPQYQD
jgi:hypothetical protein